MPITLPASSVGPVISQNYNAAIQQGSQVLLVIQIPGQGYVQVGYVTQVGESDDYGSAGFYGLGNIEPFEIQPLQFTGSLTLSGGRLYTQGWLGVLFGSAAEILASGALNIVVYNRVTAQPDITYVGFVAQNYSMTYQANAYSLQTATGLYRTVITGSS